MKGYKQQQKQSRKEENQKDKLSRADKSDSSLWPVSSVSNPRSSSIQTAHSEQQAAHSEAQGTMWLVKNTTVLFWAKERERDNNFIRQRERKWETLCDWEIMRCFLIRQTGREFSLCVRVVFKRYCVQYFSESVSVLYSSSTEVRPTGAAVFEYGPSCWRPQSPVWSGGWSCPAAPVAGLSSPSSTPPPASAVGHTTLPPCWKTHVWPAQKESGRVTL